MLIINLVPHISRYPFHGFSLNEYEDQFVRTTYMDFNIVFKYENILIIKCVCVGIGMHVFVNGAGIVQ
jgi:hypothetical protein